MIHFCNFPIVECVTTKKKARVAFSLFSRVGTSGGSITHCGGKEIVNIRHILSLRTIFP